MSVTSDAEVEFDKTRVRLEEAELWQREMSQLFDRMADEWAAKRIYALRQAVSMAVEGMLTRSTEPAKTGPEELI